MLLSPAPAHPSSSTTMQSATMDAARYDRLNKRRPRTRRKMIINCSTRPEAYTLPRPFLSPSAVLTVHLLRHCSYPSARRTFAITVNKHRAASFSRVIMWKLVRFFHVRRLFAEESRGGRRSRREFLRGRFRDFVATPMCPNWSCATGRGFDKRRAV